MSAVSTQAVWTGTKVEIRDPNGFVKELRKAKFGDGRALIVRVEPEEEAWRYSDLKHLFGHVYEPVVAYTGYTKEELHLQMKVQFMPDDGRTSITQLNREELKEFTQRVDLHLRESCPDAFLLVGDRG